jgi:hypothetical protein
VAAIPEDCHLCTEISKRRTIMQATVTDYVHTLLFVIWMAIFPYFIKSFGP